MVPRQQRRCWLLLPALLLLLAVLSSAAHAQHGMVMLHDCSKGARHVVVSSTDSVDDQPVLQLSSPGTAAGLTAALAGLVTPRELDRKAAQEVSEVGWGSCGKQWWRAFRAPLLRVARARARSRCAAGASVCAGRAEKQKQTN